MSTVECTPNLRPELLRIHVMSQHAQMCLMLAMHAGDDTGAVRLVGGSAAPGGAWEYGRLEVLVNGFWSIIDEGRFGEDLGRRGALVACRDLGYATGAQLLAGRTSALPVADPPPVGIRSVSCDGTEDVLTDCDIEFSMDGYGFDYSSGVGAVALVCSNPSGALQAALWAHRTQCV